MQKKTALVTGASSGIGKAFAYIHAERGGDLVIVARSEDKLSALKTELETKHNVNQRDGHRQGLRKAGCSV